MAGVNGAAVLTAPAAYSGPMDVARRVIQSEGGVLGLFRGLTPTFLREVPGNACMFGAYELTKQVKLLIANEPKYETVSHC